MESVGGGPVCPPLAGCVEYHFDPAGYAKLVENTEKIVLDCILTNLQLDEQFRDW